jgi:ribosomal protein L7/L12
MKQCTSCGKELSDSADFCGACGTKQEMEVKNSLYKIILEGFGSAKMNVIKAVKDATGSGLKEAKDAVESTPSIIKTGLTKDTAEILKYHLEQAGATISIYEQDKEIAIGYNLQDNIGNVKQGGCFIATAVYGAYDCPQVWTLRRYRDNALNATWYGRLLIHFYYTISPTIVKLFGKHTWFNNFFKKRLDVMTNKLSNKGVSDAPYYDKR